MISGGKVSGHFTLLKYNADTNELVETRDFDNLITNQGLQFYCQNITALHNPPVCVGIGTAVPTVNDTTLDSFLAVSNSRLFDTYPTYNTPQSPDYISTVTATARFNAGTFDGDNLTEVGVCLYNDANDGHRVWCRALILDEQGRPSAITVLANEYLDVRYVMRFHPNLNDGAFSFEMDGITYQCVTRMANVGLNAFRSEGYGTPLRRPENVIGIVYNADSTLGEITGVPVFSSGGSIGLDGISTRPVLPWSSDNPYSFFTQFTIPLSYANFSDGRGIGCLLVRKFYANSTGIQPQTQIKVTPPLPKTANSEFTFIIGQTISRWEPPTP